MKARQDNRRAAVLIVTVSVLMALSVMAVAFARLAGIDYTASRNFSGKVQSRLVAMAGIDYAMSRLTDESLSEEGYISNHGDWSYPHPTSSDNYSLDKACTTPEGGEATSVSYDIGSTIHGFYHSGVLGTSTQPTIRLYSLRIADLSGRLNLNSHISVPLSTGVPGSQGISNATLHRLVENLAQACNFDASDSASIADTLVDLSWSQAVNPDPSVPLPKRWMSYEGVVTAVNALGLDQTNSEKFLSNVTVDSWIDRSTSVVDSAPTATSAPLYRGEARAPININTASKEVLTAVLWNLRAQPVYLNNTPPGGTKSAASGDSGATTVVRDDHDVTCTPTRYTITMFNSKTAAESFADTIISYRDNAVTGPFKSWGDFDSFIESSCPIPTNVWGTQYNPGGGPAAGNGLTNSVWEDTCQDIVKSNFNPNTIDYYFNPTQPSRFRAAKSDFFSAGTRTHSTEFCFSSWGNFEISSLGMLIRRRDGAVVSRTLMRAQVSLMEVVKHSTQKQFETEDTFAGTTFPDFSSTTSYPNLADKTANGKLVAGGTASNNTYIDDNYAGRIEPHINIMPTGFKYNGTFTTGRGGTATIPASSSDRRANFPGTAPAEMLIGETNLGVRDNDNNLVNDGLLSTRTQYSTLGNSRFCSITALSGGAVRGDNNPGGNITYYKGSLEFWVKLTEPMNAQVGCGLLSATMVINSPTYPSRGDDFAEHPLDTIDHSEGIQFYVLKNTYGQLRISRVYFCTCYDADGTNLKGTHYLKDADAWDYNVEPPNSTGWTSTTHFPVPRRDVVVQNLNWEANTWHHVHISWDDTNGHAGDGGIDISIDGTAQSNTAQKINKSDRLDDPEFCLLNEKNPRDCLNIGGFFRPQAHNGRGLFKISDGDVYFPANATIAGFRIGSDTSTVTPRQIFPSSPSYTHVLRVPCKGYLGTLSWTAYPRRPGNAAHVTVQAIGYNGTTEAIDKNSQPLALGGRGFDGDGLPLDSTLVDKDDAVKYIVTFTNTGQVCSSLDDITLTVIRQKPAIYSLIEVL